MVAPLSRSAIGDSREQSRLNVLGGPGPARLMGPLSSLWGGRKMRDRKNRTGKCRTKNAGVENAGPENAGLKMRDWKLQDWKM